MTTEMTKKRKRRRKKKNKKNIMIEILLAIKDFKHFLFINSNFIQYFTFCIFVLILPQKVHVLKKLTSV